MGPPLHADDLRFDGPVSAPFSIVFAHGAGAGMDHPWMALMAQGLADRGFRVLRFDFPFMRARRLGSRRGPDRMPALQDAFREAVSMCGSDHFALAGKSMGGRVATMVADELGARGVVVYGYPFHPPGKPDQLRTAHLETIQTRTLILQGERDPFGVPTEVATYRMSPAVELQWLDDGDHSFSPRKKSGRTLEQNCDVAIEASAAFLQGATRHMGNTFVRGHR